MTQHKYCLLINIGIRQREKNVNGRPTLRKYINHVIPILFVAIIL